jgi:hypothetical protein
MSWIEIVGRSFVVFFCLTAVVNAVLVCKDLIAGGWDDED